jgi:hypothetical protein
VKGDERKHKALQVLNQVIEDAEALRIATFLNVQKRANFGGLKRNERKD